MDLATLALSLTREQFRMRFGCWFLCSDTGVARPPRPQQTDVWKVEENTGNVALPTVEGPPFAAPLMKVQEQFPSMITVGRTQNNDVVVADTSISKFHAWFRVVGERIELADAGSRNGTFVGDKRLVPKQPVALRPGEHIQLARLPFVLLEPEQAWTWIVRAMDEWG